LFICAKDLLVEATASPQTLGPKAHLLRMMNEPITLCSGSGHAVVAWAALYTVATSSPTGGWDKLLWLMVVIGAPTGWEWVLSLTFMIGLALNVLYLLRCPPR